ncbi:MAG: hypothetical protein QM784_11235 [Polyangiaceae bacterium]
MCRRDASERLDDAMDVLLEVDEAKEREEEDVFGKIQRPPRLCGSRGCDERRTVGNDRDFVTSDPLLNEAFCATLVLMNDDVRRRRADGAVKVRMSTPIAEESVRSFFVNGMQRDDGAHPSRTEATKQIRQPLVFSQ